MAVNSPVTAVQQTLVKANTHFVGNLGLYGGGATILASVAAFFKLLSDPTFLYGLAHEQGWGMYRLRLLAAFFGLVGATTVALIAAYLGRPKTV